jgi:hypothetical protein
MNNQAFTIKLSGGRQERIESFQDLADLLELEEEQHDLGRSVQITLVTTSGCIIDRSPSKFDNRLCRWDNSERRPVDLWQLLQNFLYIRLAEHHEKPYLTAAEGLGRVPGDYPHSEF